MTLIESSGIDPTKPDARLRPRILVLSDSLGFVGPERAHPTTDPRLWPNIMGRALAADVEVFAGFGWSSRHLWFALGHNPRLWSALAEADLVVFAAQFDSAPSPLPNGLWNALPRIRRRWVRRCVCGVHKRVVCQLARVTTRLPGGGPVAIRASSTARYLRESLDLVHRARPGIPVVGVSPVRMTSTTPYAGSPHAGWPAAKRVAQQWSAETGVPLLDFDGLIGEHLASDRCHPDGMHMGWEGHETVASAAARLIGTLLARQDSDTDLPVAG